MAFMLITTMLAKSSRRKKNNTEIHVTTINCCLKFCLLSIIGIPPDRHGIWLKPLCKHAATVTYNESPTTTTTTTTEKFWLSYHGTRSDEKSKQWNDAA